MDIVKMDLDEKEELAYKYVSKIATIKEKEIFFRLLQADKEFIDIFILEKKLYVELVKYKTCIDKETKETLYKKILKELKQEESEVEVLENILTYIITKRFSGFIKLMQEGLDNLDERELRINV